MPDLRELSLINDSKKFSEEVVMPQILSGDVVKKLFVDAQT